MREESYRSMRRRLKNHMRSAISHENLSNLVLLAIEIDWDRIRWNRGSTRSSVIKRILKQLKRSHRQANINLLRVYSGDVGPRADDLPKALCYVYPGKSRIFSKQNSLLKLDVKWVSSRANSWAGVEFLDRADYRIQSNDVLIRICVIFSFCPLPELHTERKIRSHEICGG